METTTQPTPETKYFALPEEVLVEVLKHLTTHPTVTLFNKVQKAVPITINPPAKTEAKAETPTT